MRNIFLNHRGVGSNVAENQNCVVLSGLCLTRALAVLSVLAVGCSVALPYHISFCVKVHTHIPQFTGNLLLLELKYLDQRHNNQNYPE